MVTITFSGNFDITQAHAASVDENFQIAKKAIETVAPAISGSDEVLRYVDPTSAPDGFLSKPMITETSITSEAKPSVQSAPAPQAAPVRVAKPVVKTVTAQPVQVAATAAHRFPYGYCTYYVASKRTIPWGGNAGTWLSGASKYGFATGSMPKVGAIMVTAEGSVGHVAYVESVNGNTFTVSEMNYAGFGRISTRTLTVGYALIKGFIY